MKCESCLLLLGVYLLMKLIKRVKIVKRTKHGDQKVVNKRIKCNKSGKYLFHNLTNLTVNINECDSNGNKSLKHNDLYSFSKLAVIPGAARDRNSTIN